MRFLRFLLFPFTALYGLIAWLRNKLFDWKWKEEFEIPLKSICVGNLSTGGTGKTPHILLLNEWLSPEKEIVIISRGYGRKTKGLIVAQTNSTPEEIGDEPMLFLSQHPKPTVIVCEKRRIAIDFLLKKKQSDALILLDDAFQHRHVKAGFSVVLTDFKKPYFNDFMLPAGNLREFRSGAKRADICIVTKCPEQLSAIEKQKFSDQLHHKKDTIYFSTITYSDFLAIGKSALPAVIETIVLVTGIANPEPLIQHLSKNYKVRSVQFKDHYQFQDRDLVEIHRIFGNFDPEKTILLTTEKDAVRLTKFEREGKMINYPWFVQKMKVEIDRKEELKKKLQEYVRKI